MKFNVVYADPCWAYDSVKSGGSGTSGAAAQYDTMSLDEICAMPVPSIAARDSLCFLWATTPLGDWPFQVLKAWGYEYKTKWYWYKRRFGLGYWTRGTVEELLIGVRGNVRAWRSDYSNWMETLTDEPVFDDKTGLHSRKPPEVAARIVELTPGVRRAELFARVHAPGFEAYGLGISAEHDFRTDAFWEWLAGGKLKAGEANGLRL